MSDMADVIRLHSQIGRDENGQYCKGCQHRYGYAAERKLNWHASEHVAAALSAAGFGSVWKPAAPEVRYVDLTTGEKNVLDEVVAFDAYVHLEAMDNNHWWLMVTSGGTSVRINLYTRRAKITAHADIEDAEGYREAGNAARSTVLDEVAAERERQDAKWGEQNHPNGTGDNQEFIRPAEYVDPAGEHILATMGTFAYRMKHRTDERAQRGTVTFADILLEEVFEALAEEDPAKLRAELIQVAAVAAQWVEAIDRAAS